MGLFKGGKRVRHGKKHGRGPRKPGIGGRARREKIDSIVDEAQRSLGERDNPKR